MAEPSTGDDANDPAPPCRAYTGTTRPAHIGSQAWLALQSSERLKIAAREAVKEAERLRESEPPMLVGEDGKLLEDGATSFSETPISEANISRSGSCDVTAVENATPSRAVPKEPVIIEYCCDPESMMGQVKKCKVLRITKEHHDQLTPKG